MIEVRTMRASRARWLRWSRPVMCWFRNRWNWRRARKVRRQTQRWEQLTVRLEDLEPSDDPDVQRIAEVAESLGYSNVLHLGYGMGEAVLAAHRHQPQRLRPFVERACQFTNEELRGRPDAADVHDAVRARNDLLTQVRETLAAHCKTRQQ